MRKWLCSWFSVTALVLGVGCAERLVANDADISASSDDGTGAAPANLPAKSGKFTHTALGDGSIISTVVDATDTEIWQKLDLDSGYADTDGWDLAFRRFVVLSNGGVTGHGGVQLLALPGQDFDTLTQAPGADAAWGVDQADGPDDDTTADNAFSDWYDYDVNDHTLTPKDIVFVVRSSEGNFFKLRIENYYDKAGTSGVVTFRWAKLQAPASDLPPTDVEPDPDGGLDDGDGSTGTGGGTSLPADSLYVDARSYDDWVYVDIDDGVVTVADPTVSSTWDLAVQRFVFRTNSGTSGPGAGGAKLDTSGASFDDLTSTSADGFTVDAMLDVEGPSGATNMSTNDVLVDWYDYQANHTLLPKPNVYVIRRGDGTYAKLRIDRYTSGELRLSLLPLSLASP